jgi:arylsulfatase
MMKFFGHQFWRFVYVQDQVAELGRTIVEFPPMQKSASFNLERVKEQILKALHGPHSRGAWKHPRYRIPD